MVHMSLLDRSNLVDSIFWGLCAAHPTLVFFSLGYISRGLWDPLLELRVNACLAQDILCVVWYTCLLFHYRYIDFISELGVRDRLRWQV